MLSRYNTLKGIKPPGYYNIFIIVSPQALLGLYCPKASGLLFKVSWNTFLTSATWSAMKSKAKRVQIMSHNTFLNLFWLNMSVTQHILLFDFGLLQSHFWTQILEFQVQQVH